MFPQPVRAPIWAFILISAGGLLLHIRIHPPGASAYYWVPVVFGVANVVLLPVLLAGRTTAGWGFALTVLTAVVGTVTMAWHSVVGWSQPLTLPNVLLLTTFPDILIVAGKVPLAWVVLDYWRHTVSGPVSCAIRAEGPYEEAGRGVWGAEVARPEVISGPSRALARVALAAAMGALLAVAAWIGLSGHPAGGGPDAVLVTLGRVTALLAAMLLMLQFSLSARLSVVDRACGLDRALRCHRYLGAVALTLAAAHPAFLYASGRYVLGPLRAEILPEIGGIAIAALLFLLVLTSDWRALLGLRYEAWHWLHYAGFVVVAMVTAHATQLGGSLRTGWPRAFWLTVFAAYVLLFLWAKVVRPRLLDRRRYRVTSVRPVSHDTYRVALEPMGHGGIRQVPGQFAFVRFLADGLPPEQHPFTISSCPVRSGAVEFTIKQSGDFTCRIGSLKEGDQATLEGPYGWFSHLLLPPGDLLMVAGGVGITPLLSMLRHMAATGDTRRVTLIWGNKTEADILYARELAALQEAMPDLRVHHVMSSQGDYVGSRGLVDDALLKHLAAEELKSHRVLLCGPPAMVRLVSVALRRLGVPSGRVHAERFEL